MTDAAQDAAVEKVEQSAVNQPPKKRGWLAGVFAGAAVTAGFAGQFAAAAMLAAIGLKTLDDFSRQKPFYEGISPIELSKGGVAGVAMALALGLSTQINNLENNHLLVPVNEPIAQARKTLGDSWQPAASLQDKATALAAQDLAAYYKAQGECLAGGKTVPDCLKPRAMQP